MSLLPPTPIKHVAIIMDGNGRWAQSRCHQRVWGHVRGSRVVSKIVEQAEDMGVEALTLYAFSSENWARPLSEIQLLFKLLKKFLMMERGRILKNHIRFKVMGDTSSLPQETQKLISELEKETRNFKGLKLTFAFGYGGRSEIVSAANKFHQLYPDREMTEADFQEMLFVPDLSDVDLLIRTGGDQRISNFLLWQLAYAEFYFTSTKWPDFTKCEFQEILLQVMSRERRFGAIQKSSHLEDTICLAKENKRMLDQRSYLS